MGPKSVNNQDAINSGNLEEFSAVILKSAEAIAVLYERRWIKPNALFVLFLFRYQLHIAIFTFTLSQPRNHKIE
jgi:hypothetical protein